MSIVLTSGEKELFAELQALAETYRPEIELRVAGGWVRDKLLGKQSPDIDIALNAGSGVEFAQILAKHKGLSSPGLIKVNPDKSKHLETAKLTLTDGIELDFAILRSETYGESRIPQITAGTAHSDAHRRDFTINSLFFNLKTLTVEDHTGFGLEDLKNGVLRTPLEPEKTFSDDPLRLLRGIRFAASLGFEIAFPLRYEGFLDTLMEKVSRERITIELRKAFHSDAEKSFALLEAAELCRLIVLRTEAHIVEMRQAVGVLVANGAHELPEILAAAKLIVKSKSPQSEIALSLSEEKFIEKILTPEKHSISFELYPTHTVLFYLYKSFKERAEIIKAATVRHCVLSDECFAAKMSDLFSELEGYTLPELRVNGKDITDWLEIFPGPAVGNMLRLCEFLIAGNRELTRDDLKLLVKEAYMATVFRPYQN